jgi:preprotein translocase subunit SecD
MKKGSWRLILIVVVLALAIVLVYPRHEGEYINVNLGLDLQGGSLFQFRVMTEDAIRSEVERRGESLRQELSRRIRRDAAGFSGVRIEVPEDDLGRFRLFDIPPDQVAESVDFVKDQISGWTVSPRADGLEAAMPGDTQRTIREEAVVQVLDKVRNRIDEFGVAEAAIHRMGFGAGDRIKVELPGVGNTRRLQDLIQEQARLEWRKMVYPPGAQSLPPFNAEADALAYFGGSLPPDAEVLSISADRSGSDREQFYVVERTAVVTGTDLEEAFPDQDEFGGWQLSFVLKPDAARRFRRATRENVGKQMPIILDRRVLTAPVIESEIGARGRITGRGDREWYTDLALKLRSGALPAKLEVLENRTVGPSLGRDSIRQSLAAGVAGFVFVILFMLVYYRGAGFNAMVALVMNLLLVFASMAALRYLFKVTATLTLPGIAGLILTIGMAVDANVLVFERIREELRRGRTVRSAIEVGFGKALTTILDANITTMIAALFLFEFGTGPVQGFAVTLMIGILASMFTAIFVSRTIFDTVLGRRRVKRLSI